MNTSFDNLRNFFDRVKSITLWQRIFNWSSLKLLSYDAYEEFKKLSESIDLMNRKLTEDESGNRKGIYGTLVRKPQI